MRTLDNTRQFVTRAAAFLAVQAVVFAVFVAMYRVDQASYLAMSIRKQALLREFEPPRIILVGGSAVAFGFHSPTIARSFECQTINMGVQGSLGLSIKLAEVLESLGRGDRVVLSLEYEHYAGTMREGLTVWGWLEQDWSRARYLSLDDGKAVLDSGHLYLRNITTTVLRTLASGRANRVKPPYDPHSFNRQGDVVGHRGMKAEGIAGQAFIAGGFRESSLERAVDEIADFRDDAARRGARVFVYFPPIPRRAAQSILPVLDRLARIVDEAGLEALDHPRDVLWDDDRFFDTLYHLTWDGQAANTAFLIERLRRAPQ